MPETDPRLIELRARREQASKGGGTDRVARQHARGKLTARERVTLLVDPDSFHELLPFVTHQGNDLGIGGEPIPGDGVITGYGQVNGRIVYVYAQDFTVYGGTVGEMHSRKICSLMDLAVEAGVPVVGLIDSGGARIQEGVRALGAYAEIFRRNARYSGVIPQISVLMGPCAGGAAYSPALTDFIVMVEGIATMFLTGPDVIKTVTGEVVDAEALGGAHVHAAISGNAHLVAPDEATALGLCRDILGYLPSNRVENPPFIASADPAGRMDEALNALVPLDPAQPYAMHDVLAHVVDAGSFLEIQPEWARNCIVGFARLGGYSVGIVAQEPSVMAGVIDLDAADKITRFVRTCDCYNVPIVTFVDSPGFLPGVEQEYRGIIRHGAKVLYAYSEATVPKVSVITRKAYGGAYVVMSSKYIGTDIAYGWPSAEIAVMGAEAAVRILYREQIESSHDRGETERELTEDYRERFGSPYAAAAAGYLDEVIEPAETRPRLIAALTALRDKFAPPPPRKHGNIPV